ATGVQSAETPGVIASCTVPAVRPTSRVEQPRGLGGSLLRRRTAAWAAISVTCAGSGARPALAVVRDLDQVLAARASRGPCSRTLPCRSPPRRCRNPPDTDRDARLAAGGHERISLLGGFRGSPVGRDGPTVEAHMHPSSCFHGPRVI